RRPARLRSGSVRWQRAVCAHQRRRAGPRGCDPAAGHQAATVGVGARRLPRPDHPGRALLLGDGGRRSEGPPDSVLEEPRRPRRTAADRRLRKQPEGHREGLRQGREEGREARPQAGLSRTPSVSPLLRVGYTKTNLRGRVRMVNWQRGVVRLMRITNHEVIVTGIEDFTARYRRIAFSGPELLAQLDEVFPTLWTRLWFPHPEKGEGHLSQRGYTFAAIDLEAGTFSLDFVLHGDLGEDASASTAGSGPGAAGGGSGTADIGTADTGTADVGPGARWAARARPGTKIEAALTPA